MRETRVNLQLPKDLVGKVDIAAMTMRKNRTEVIEEALQKYLDEIEEAERFKEGVVELYLDDEIGFESLNPFLGRDDADAVRTSKAILDRGDELAQRLVDLGR